MSGSADIEDVAAEYVLGTLDAGERTAVAARRQREPHLDAAILAWERRLAPLAELTPPVQPPAGLYGRIEQQITSKTEAGAASPSTLSPSVIELQRRLRRWRLSTLAATALAASLAVAIGVRENMRPETPQNFVAVFQQDNVSPSFVMSVDIASRTLSLRRVAAQVPQGKSYQLWIVSDKLGPDPRSLGLVDSRDTVVKTAAGIDQGTVENAVYGVSLEPAGGSPTGKPTGPVFLAKLIPTPAPK